MAKRSVGKNVTIKTAEELPRTTKVDLKRVHAAMERKIDVSEIPERKGSSRRLQRDAAGRLPPRNSMIREAVTQEMENRNFTVYRLWKEAREHCPTLSQSAVSEFLKGQRQLELAYAEALMAAVHLRVVRSGGSRR